MARYMTDCAATRRAFRLEVPERFNSPPGLCALMEAVGLRGVKYRRLGLGTVTIHTGIA